MKIRKPMRISRIELTGIRCFEHCEIDLTSRRGVKKWVMLAGDNGVGKSTLLRCIAIGLCDEAGAGALIRDAGGRLIRYGAQTAKISISLKGSGRQAQIDTIIKESPAGFQTVEQHVIPEGGLPWDGILACGYGANRSTEGSYSYEEYSLVDAVYTLFNYDCPLQDPELMLRRRAKTKDEEREVCHWLDDTLMLPRGSTVLTDGGIEISGRWGNNIPMVALGDGYQGTLTWILDMLGWAQLAGKGREKNRLNAIVFIDELEQHLHPKWQRHITRLLGALFPQVQFIVTTHSPMCAAGVSDLPSHKTALVVLEEEPMGSVRCLPQSLPIGWRYDQLLTSDVFGLPSPRSNSSADLLAELNRLYLIENRNPAQERALRKLSRQLGALSATLAEDALQRKIEAEIYKSLKRLKRQLGPKRRQ